ncbi:MAG: hypothetical protein AAFX87_03075 [Bacteroidota bacterium]
MRERPEDHRHVALINANGDIISVNKAWEKFAIQNNGDSSRIGIGVNYLDICKRSKGRYSSGAYTVFEGIQTVIEGRSQSFGHQYPCHSPEERRWFSMEVVKMQEDKDIFSVIHSNVTNQKRLELLIKGGDMYRTRTNRTSVASFNYVQYADGNTSFQMTESSMELAPYYSKDMYEGLVADDGLNIQHIIMPLIKSMIFDNGKLKPMKFEFPMKSGSQLRWFLSEMSPKKTQINGMDAITWLGQLKDITEPLRVIN